jgi:hypothetical protein
MLSESIDSVSEDSVSEDSVSEDSAMEESSQDESEDRMETTKNSDEKTEEVVNLQLACEILGLAKVVYTWM